jgi:hypothetical protein
MTVIYKRVLYFSFFHTTYKFNRLNEIYLERERYHFSVILLWKIDPNIFLIIKFNLTLPKRDQTLYTFSSPSQ